jgi:hypothetical protein
VRRKVSLDRKQIDVSRKIGDEAMAGLHKGDEMYTFDCGIVFVDEMTLYQLDGETRLSHTTAAHNDELIFSQKLRRSSLAFLRTPTARGRPQERGASHLRCHPEVRAC